MTDETTSEQLAEIEGQPEPVQVREGRWRTRGGQEFRVSPMPTDHWDFAPEYPWWDGHVTTWRTDGRFSVHQNAMDLVEYLGPIEPDKTQELPDKTQELPEYTPPEGWRVVRFGELLQPGDVWVNQDGTEQRSNILQWDASAVSGGRCIRRMKPQPEPQAEPHTEQQIEELRSEVSYVQNLLGTERRRVTQLEELVASLRAINEAQEKAFTAAGKENTALRNQLAAVASVAADRQRLLIELDAAQQVPADSPELRQLRADLADVTRERDTFWHAHELLVKDANTAHERTKAMTVEAIAEWLEPIRREDPHLRAVILFHLPKIIRSLAGLNTPEDVD